MIRTAPGWKAGWENLRPGAYLAGLLVVATVITGFAIVQGLTVVAVLPTILVLTVLLSFSSLGPYGIVLLSVCSLIYVYAYPQIAIAGLSFYWAEGGLALCVAASLLHLRRHGPGLAIRFRGDLVLVGLLAVLAVAGVFVSVANGTGAKTALMATRGVVYYAVCIPAFVALASRSSQKITMRFVAGLAVVLSCLLIAQAALGAGVRLFVAGDSSTIVAIDQQTGFLRVRPPGLTLVYVVAAFALASLLWGPRRNRAPSALIFGVTFAGVLVSLNRNMVIGLVAGVLAATLFGRHRARTFAVLLSTALFVVVAVFALSGFGSNPIVNRWVSLGDYQGLVQTTLSDRYYETGYALAALEKSPILGIGWGADYGAAVSADTRSVLSEQMRGWLHNQYLDVWLRMGLAGLLCVIALLYRGVSSGLTWYRRAPDDSAWIGLGLVIAVVSLGLSAFVGTYFMTPDSIVPLAGALALGFVLRNTAQGARRRERTSALPDE